VSPLLYAVNIGTLATWITVSGASTVAVAIKVHERLPKLNEVKPAEIELAFIEEPMGSAQAAAPETAEISEEDVLQEELPVPEEEVPEVPEMPEIPEVAELEPLPDIPDLPVKPDGEIKPKPQPAVKRTSDQPKQPKRTQTTGRRSGPTGNGSGTGAGTAQGSGSSASGASRWVGLRTGRLNYPSDCKRAGQQGRVKVVFTVDERGYVVNARVIGPCPYPGLNEAALKHVRGFRARPGPRATNSQTIVFQIN
jgi:TonB family protein